MSSRGNSTAAPSITFSTTVMINNNEELLNEANVEYTLVTKHMDDILYDMRRSEHNTLVCKSIITSIERNIADSISAGHIVAIPNIGCIRRNPVRSVIVKNYMNFREARKQMDKETYVEFVRGVYKEAKEKDEEHQKYKRNIKTLRKVNKKKYDELVIKAGAAYATMYIYAIFLLDEVLYDQEVQDAYDALTNK